MDQKKGFNKLEVVEIYDAAGVAVLQLSTFSTQSQTEKRRKIIETEFRYRKIYSPFWSGLNTKLAGQGM